MIAAAKAVAVGGFWAALAAGPVGLALAAAGATKAAMWALYVSGGLVAVSAMAWLVVVPSALAAAWGASHGHAETAPPKKRGYE